MSGMTPEEHFTVNGVAAFNGFKSFATPPTTSASGTFIDVPVGTCFTTTVQTPNPCVNVVQSFELVNGGNTFSIVTTTGRRDCALGNNLTTTGNPTGKNNSYSQGTVN